MNIGNSFNSQTTNYVNQNKENVQDALSKIGATRELSGKDGASLIVSNSLSTQISELTQNIQNENESVAMYQIADSTLRDVRESSDKLNKLSIAHGNGALSDEQKSFLESEFKATIDSMKDAIDTTKYNGKSLFSSQLDLEVSGLENLSIEDQDSITSFMKEVQSLSSQVGSSMNKSEVSISNSLSAVSNVTSAYGNIAEEPMDTKISDLFANQVKLESSVLAQNHQKEVLQQRISSLLV